MRRVVLAAVSLASLAMACRPAPTRPDFSGTWLFDAARSTLQVPAPDSLIFVIDHRDPLFRMSNTHYTGADSTTFAIDLTTDSAEVEHSTADVQLRSRSYWDGDVVVFTATFPVQGGEVSNITRYTLADGGRGLIANEHLEMGQLTATRRRAARRTPAPPPRRAAPTPGAGPA